MNFLQAFEKVNQDQTAAAAAPAKQADNTEDLKAYIDAKFEGIRSEIDNKMSNFLKSNNIEEVKVETPEENTNAASQKIENEGGNENASKSDL